VKKPARKAIDTKGLRKTFIFLNSRFFENRIPGSLRVEFMKNCGHEDEEKKGTFQTIDAFFDKARDAIFIEEKLKFFPDYAAICLLHEMVHVDLRFQGYEGWPIDKGHGTRFHGEIVRLIKAGAYDGLL